MARTRKEVEQSNEVRNSSSVDTIFHAHTIKIVQMFTAADARLLVDRGGKFAARGKTYLTAKDPEGSKDQSSDATAASQITKETMTAQCSKLKRHEVFNDLDNAERLVMHILSITTWSTSEAFSSLALNTQIMASEENGNDGTVKKNDTFTTQISEEWARVFIQNKENT